MYYLPYEQKILKIARIRDQIYRFRFLILGVLFAILSAIMALLAVKGNIVNDISLQPSYVYGERITPNATAFLSGVEYEYFAGTWTSEQPKRPGEYSIRAKAKGGFGGYKYGETKKFKILPKDLTFTIAESVTYGNTPVLTFSGLLAEDKVEDTSFSFQFDGIATEQAAVMLEKDSLKIFSDCLGDVTDCYQIDNSLFEMTPIRILPRPISLQVCDAEKMYDGTPLTATDYIVSSGNLMQGDMVSVEYTGEQVLFGQSDSGLNANFTNEQGENYNSLYKLTVIPGKLNITKRPIAVTTGSAEKVYDGVPLTCSTLQETGEYAVLPNEEIKILSCTELLDAGSIDNYLHLTIQTATGEDRGDCYEIAQTCGNLQITPKTVEIAFKSEEYVYNGFKYTELVDITNQTIYDILSKDGIIDGETLSVQFAVMQNGATADGRRVGNYEIVLGSYTVKSTSRDTTNNYNLIYQSGSLTIMPRYVQLHIYGAQKIYDAKPYDYDNPAIKQAFCAGDGDYPWASNEYCSPAVFIEPYVDAGIYTNAIQVTPKFYSAVYKDETTSNYEIDLIMENGSGCLIIEKRWIELHLQDCERPYNGEALTSTLYTFETIEENRLLPVSGHTAQVTAGGSITEPGTILNEVISVKMMAGKEDVTHNYDILALSGSLTVPKRYINVTPVPYKKVYDGEAVKLEKGHPIYATWINPEDNQYGKALLSGYTMRGEVQCAPIVDVNDTATLSYIRENTFAIYDAKGKDVTDKYFVVQYVAGKVWITPRELHIVSQDVTQVYKEGEVLQGSAKDCYIAKGSLVNGYTIEYEIETILTQPGSKTNRINSITLRDKYGHTTYRMQFYYGYDKYVVVYSSNINYSITITCGTLTLLPSEDE